MQVTCGDWCSPFSGDVSLCGRTRIEYDGHVMRETHDESIRELWGKVSRTTVKRAINCERVCVARCSCRRPMVYLAHFDNIGERRWDLSHWALPCMPR